MAKKIFQYDEEGNVVFKYKVSSECLRHAIFQKEIPFENPSLKSNRFVFYNLIGQPGYICRGYMETVRGGNTIRKKSPLTISDAVETGAWRDKITFDFHSKSGTKDTEAKSGKDDQSDTSLHSIENVGNNTYVSTGFIDVSELQFISADPLYDRMAVEATGDEACQMFLQSLGKSFPTMQPEFDYYAMTNAYVQDEWAELGILLDTESVDKLIKEQLKKIADVKILRRGSFLSFDSFDSITVKTSDGEITIKYEDIDNYKFEYAPAYYKADAEMTQKNIELAKEFKKQQKATEKNSTKKKSQK